jgi:hypothetical protein
MTPYPLMVRPATTHPSATAHQPGDQININKKKTNVERRLFLRLGAIRFDSAQRPENHNLDTIH